MTRRPRLLVLASTFPSSVDDSTPAFVRDLAMFEAGAYDTTVLVPAIPGAPDRELLGPLTVRRFRFFPRRWEDLANGAILENVRARRSRMLQVPSFLVAETAAVHRVTRETQPDVIHAHWIVPQGLAALIAAPHVPTLVTTLGGDLYGLTDPLSKRIIRAVVQHAGAVTTMNEDMLQRIVGLGADPQRSHVLPMAADTQAVQAIANQQTVAAGRILFVGRLVEKKGLAVLLDAIRLLPSGRIELNVVGDGPLRAELERQASGLPVSFLGGLSASELAQQYGQAEIVVFPSVRALSGDQDGLPVALLEAMAAGCAVVGTDLPGLRDAIQDGISGLLVPSGNAKALASALHQAMADPVGRAKLGRGAKARSLDYSVDVIGDQYIALLDQVRSRYPRSGPDGDQR